MSNAAAAVAAALETAARNDYSRWGGMYGVGFGRPEDHGHTADQALDRLADLARKHNHPRLLEILELNRERGGPPEGTLHYMTMLLGVSFSGNPPVAARNFREAARKIDAEKRRERKQERQRTARDEHKQRQGELRIREAIAGLVTRVLAAPVEEARRVEEDAKKATAARLAPTIALNKRLVRDKMVRVDRERRQRARVMCGA